MSSLVFRREPFGAIIGTDDDRALLINERGARLFELCAEGLSDSAIAELVENTNKPSGEFVTELAFFRGLINGEEARNIDASEIDDSSIGFPALSFPFDLSWEITRRCNEHCAHCYNDSGAQGFEPSESQIEQVLSEIENYQLRSVTLTGGEPLLRKEIWNIAEKLRPNTYRLVLATNGTLIDAEIAEHIADLFDLVNVSFDSSDPHEFDHFGGLDKAYTYTLNGLRFLKACGVPVIVQTVVAYNGIRNLEVLGELLESLKIDGWSVRLPFPSGRAREGETLFPIEEARFFEHSIEVIRLKFEGRIPNVFMGSKYPWSADDCYEEIERSDRLLTCAAATLKAILCADGTLAPCPLFSGTNFRSEPIWDSSLLSAWHSASCFKELRQVRFSQIPLCYRCSKASLCGENVGCRALAYMKFGTIFAPDGNCAYSIRR
jgi:radical SAM protein with 4Fe4S-binding SPASM domain